MAQDPTPPLPPERLAALRAIPLECLPSPSFVIHMGLLEGNCRLLRRVADRCGARVLLALKGFACHAAFPVIRKHLDGTTASGLHEALLALEHFGGEIHAYSPAFKEPEIATVARFAHTMVFNSPAQLKLGAGIVAGLAKRPEIGLRVNPEYSESDTSLYDPCSPNSRLGVTRAALDRARAPDPDLLESVDGFHFHTLCEQDADALEHTADALEEKFGDLIAGIKWLNFGGGHHITRPGYDIDRLSRIVKRFRECYGVGVYLEPGEAVALHTGVLAASIVDIVDAGELPVAILDVSATCHMPDVLEMPYRPTVLDAAEPGELPHSYRLGGPSCLAGDIIGDYSFAEPLKTGDRIVFLDMSHYTMVKTTTFNGVPLPAICLTDTDGRNPRVVRRFHYNDYSSRLA